MLISGHVIKDDLMCSSYSIFEKRNKRHIVMFLLNVLIKSVVLRMMTNFDDFNKTCGGVLSP